MSTVNKITVTKNNSSNTYELKDVDALRAAAVANVENGSVASRSYVEKEYLYRNDILYRVDIPIPSGGTFIENQNIIPVVLTAEMEKSAPTIIPNSQGTVSAELETLQIGLTVYSVGGGTTESDKVAIIGSDDTETTVPTSKITPIEVTVPNFTTPASSFIFFRLGRSTTINQRPSSVTTPQDYGLYFNINNAVVAQAYYNDTAITESEIFNLDKKKIYMGHVRAISGDPLTYRIELHEIDDMSAGIDNVIVGIAAHAEGKNTTAYGDNTHSEGSSTCAYGSNSHAEGQGTTAYGSQSHAEGASTYANYVESHAEGTMTTANGQGSHAEGGYTYAKGLFSHSEGDATTAWGSYTHAEGISTYAIADYSHAEGYSTSSQGNYSHSEGMNTSAVGHQTHAEGNQCTALGDQSHAEGYKTYAVKDYSHAEGSQTCAPGLSAHSENYYTKAIGDYSHAEGNYTTANGDASHAEGYYTYANSYAHAEGSGKAYGSYSHAEGSQTNTSKQASHAEGSVTYAIGEASHAEGYCTTAEGDYSHSQGNYTTAKGNRSSAAGKNTIAGYNDQFVLGYYNDNKEDNLFEIGNGTYETKSNALEVDTEGNLLVSGTITDGDGNVLGPGGTTVVANPAEASTDTLTKLQVGSTVYGISGGSGGGVPAEVITENIETTITSSQAYAIGDFLYKNDELYKAKTAIAQGDTFVIDTNIEETNITDEINTLKTNFQDGVDAVYDACVSKGSTPSSHALADVVDAIDNISGGTLGTKNITINGTYNASSDNLDGYSSVTVNVSGGTTPIQINPFPQGASAIPLYNENGITINTSSIDVSGTAAMNFTEAQAGYEGFVIELNVTPGKVYTVEFDYQNISVAYQENNYALGYLIETTPRTNYSAQTNQDNNIPRDNTLHHHKNMVLATTSHIYMNFNVCAYADSQTNIAEITNLKVYEITSGTTDDILRYNFVTKDTSGRGATITINKYVNDALILSTDYGYNSQAQPITIDNYFTLDYAVTAGYCWTYHLLKGSKSHNIGYTKSQGYGEIVDINEIFIDNVALGSKTITQNGIYFPSNDNLDAYSKVIVDVSSGGGSAINVTSQIEEMIIPKGNGSSLLEITAEITSTAEEVI